MSRASYGDAVLENLSFKLANEFGKGFSKRNFSSEYKLHMPTEQELIAAVEEEKKYLELNEDL